MSLLPRRSLIRHGVERRSRLSAIAVALPRLRPPKVQCPHYFGSGRKWKAHIGLQKVVHFAEGMIMAEEAAAELLTIKELSVHSRLSPATLHRLKRQGKLPYFQPSGPGGRLLFPTDAIEQCAAAVASEQTTQSATAREPRRHLSGRCPAWMQPTDTSQETSDNATEP